jgi:hypothetical protein
MSDLLKKFVAKKRDMKLCIIIKIFLKAREDLDSIWYSFLPKESVNRLSYIILHRWDYTFDTKNIREEAGLYPRGDCRPISEFTQILSEFKEKPQGHYVYANIWESSGFLIADYMEFDWCKFESYWVQAYETSKENSKSNKELLDNIYDHIETRLK